MREDGIRSSFIALAVVSAAIAVFHASTAISGTRDSVAVADPLADAKAVVFKCGAGSETGKSLGIDADVGGTLAKLFSVSGRFDAGYFSFVRAAMFRRIDARDREKAYEAYVDCIKALASPSDNKFDAEREKIQGQIAERLEQLAGQTLELSGLLASGEQRRAESEKILVQQLDALKTQLADLQKRSQADPAVVRGVLAETALLGATREFLAAGDYAAALGRFEQAMLNRQVPPTADLLSLKARILYGLMRYEDAANIAQQALSGNDMRSLHAQIEDKRLLSDALTRVARGAQLKKAVDIGVEVAQADLSEVPPNVSGALGATATAAQASLRSSYGEESIRKMAAQLDEKATAYAGGTTQLLYYSEALARFQLDRFIRLRNQVEFSATTSRIAAWKQRLEMAQADAGRRADAALLEAQLFRWTLQIDDSWAKQGFDGMEADLIAAAQLYVSTGEEASAAQAKYGLALLKDHTGKYSECAATLYEASMRAPATSALAADIQALAAKCADSAGMPNAKASREKACQFARAIVNVDDQGERVEKYCGVDK